MKRGMSRGKSRDRAAGRAKLLAVLALAYWCVRLGSNQAAAADPVPWTLPTLFARVPPLKHDANGRWPMICIEPFRLSADDNSFAQGIPLPAETIRELLKRGLTQHIPPRIHYLDYAKAFQAAGSPVIFMEGSAFNGPAGDVPDGLHRLPPDFQRDPEQPAQQPSYPCPLLLEGWRLQADQLRTTYRAFRDAGVTVNAAWLDWEIEPYPGKSQWREAKACSRCRDMFPPGVLDDFDRYRAFITRWRVGLFSAYVAAPILEVFPRCSVTNWELVLSSADHPTPRWSGAGGVPPVDMGLFTAANPVAYGNTAWYRVNWKEAWNWPLDELHMDRVYTSVMLGQFSAHAENARRTAPETQSIPWVDRYCADDRDPKIPILSRTRYREILRHLWLRGADGMQIFNPNWFGDQPEKHAIVTEEIEDAVAVYDELLADRRFLDAGIIMNTSVLAPPDDTPIWSGLRLGDEAVVRTFTQGPAPARLTITPFDGAGPIELESPPQGATYRLKKEAGKVTLVNGAR
jgi:hypothetical protein